MLKLRRVLMRLPIFNQRQYNVNPKQTELVETRTITKIQCSNCPLHSSKWKKMVNWMANVDNFGCVMDALAHIFLITVCGVIFLFPLGMILFIVVGTIIILLTPRKLISDSNTKNS
jgi:hypothetical protein